MSERDRLIDAAVREAAKRQKYSTEDVRRRYEEYMRRHYPHDVQYPADVATVLQIWCEQSA